MSSNKSEELSEGIKLNRKDFRISVGAVVVSKGEKYKITQILDFETVVAISEGGRAAALRVNELRPVSTEESFEFCNDLEDIPDERWKIAQERYAAVLPLLNGELSGRSDVERRAKELHINTATLYRWLKRYRATGTLSSLIPLQRGWTLGKSRLSFQAEELIEEVIEEYFLTRERPSFQSTINEVKRRCKERNIEKPSAATIRSRLSAIPEKKALRGRGLRELAEQQFKPVPGNFPGADYPLAYIQIDHTPIDLILVDDEFRKPIGKPWITVAIDVFTRVVTGYYLSFDPPSGTSVAMCIAHSFLPKEKWLALHNVEADWPVWGKPAAVHVDNGPDFKSDDFRKSCQMHSIRLEFRPVKQPRYGGHIERLLGTFLNDIHNLPGTTFSSVAKRKGYDSEKHAIMTLEEFERWFVTHVCKVYHKRKHSVLGRAPIKFWEEQIFGSNGEPGIGMPPRPVDPQSLQLDFLPSHDRTVQNFGVTIDGIRYYSDVLRAWINLKEKATGKNKKYVFRRDPRNINQIWFYEPNSKRYFAIPYANLALPSMSLWELNAVKERLKQRGISDPGENQILDGLTELRTIVEDSREKTKKAPRQAQRRKENAKNITPAEPSNISKIEPTESMDNQNMLLDGDDIQGFEDIE